MAKKVRTYDPVTRSPMGLAEELRFLLFSSSYEDIQEILQTSSNELERLAICLHNEVAQRKEILAAAEFQRDEMRKDMEVLRDENRELKRHLDSKHTYYTTVTSNSTTSTNVLYTYKVT